MSKSLRDPSQFKKFNKELSKNLKFDNSTPKYNLESIYNYIKTNEIPKGYISQLFNKNILNGNPNIQKILKKFFGYDKYNDSLVVFLKENNQIKTISIHRSNDKDNNIIKWKTLGSKQYIQHNIKDNYIFIVYGMAEIILCEILELSYVAFQSDSIVKNLSSHEQFQNQIKPNLKDKIIIPLLDNDRSCINTVSYLKNELNNISKKIIVLNMYSLHDMYILTHGGKTIKKLPSGYDFRDLVNMVEDTKKIKIILEESIKAHYE